MADGRNISKALHNKLTSKSSEGARLISEYGLSPICFPLVARSVVYLCTKFHVASPLPVAILIFASDSAYSKNQ